AFPPPHADDRNGDWAVRVICGNQDVVLILWRLEIAMFRYSLRKRLLISAGVVFIFFCWGCLNYKKASGWEHQNAFAEKHGLPKPSERILFAGAGALLIGGGLVGYSMGGQRPAL